MATMIEEKKSGEKAAPAAKGLGGKKRGVDKWKKKSWYVIFSPDEFEKQEIAHTVSEKPEMLLGRTIWVSAAQIAKQPRLSHIMLRFGVTSVQGQKAFTEIHGFAIQDGYLKRIVRRRTSKMEVVKTVTSKDGAKARVKLVTISVQRLTEKQRTDIRKIMGDELEKAAQHRDFKVLAQELIFGNVASNIVKQAKKISAIKRTEAVKCQLVEQPTVQKAA